VGVTTRRESDEHTPHIKEIKPGGYANVDSRANQKERSKR